MTQEDLEAYLRRLCITRRIAPDTASLRLLVRSHLEQIPFENLDILDGKRPLPLDEDKLFDKIVVRRRGGYCFELNKLFYLLLQAVGFHVYPACAKIVYRRTEERPWSHRVSIVRNDAGSTWLCDVGFGGPGPKGALRLDMRKGYEVEGTRFFSNREGCMLTVLREDPDGLQPLMRIWDQPCSEADFEVMSYYFSTCPQAVFTQKRILYRCTSNGQLSLIGDHFTHEALGQIVGERDITDPLLRTKLLRQEFGIDLAPRPDPDLSNNR